MVKANRSTLQAYSTVQSIFRYLAPFRRTSPVWQTDGWTDKQKDGQTLW